MGKVKNHFKKHKVAYISVGTLVVGTGIGILIGQKIELVQSAKQINVLSKNPTFNNVQVALVERSTPSKPLFDPSTNKLFNSISDASRELGKSRNMVRKLVETGDLKELNVIAEAAK